MTYKISRVVGYLFIVVTLTIFLVTIIEAAYIVYKTHKKQSIESTRLHSLSIAFDNQYSSNELKEMTQNVGDHLKYRPWTQFGNYDHANKYSIVENGVRKTTENSCANTKKIKIWFFGGSTMYGIGVPWWNSIPSQFVDYAKTQGKCIEATNFGVPYFFSMQETVYFTNMLIKNGAAPDIAIFLDGLNDFGQPGSSIYSEPFFTPILEASIPHQNTIEVNLLKNNHHWFENLFTYKLIKDKIIKSPVSKNYIRNNDDIPFNNDIVSTEDAAIKIAQNYLRSSKALDGLCKEYKTNCFQFLQPIAIKNYSPPENLDTLTLSFRTDPSLAQKRSLFTYGYEHLKKMQIKNTGRDSQLKFFDISDALINYNGLAYVDSGHYSPRATNQISKVIYKLIFY